MLSDNALLARVYLDWWRLTGEPDGARVALETCDWMLAALRTPEGGLASSLDADTPVEGPDGRVTGVEGAGYVWTPSQLADVLGPEEGAWAAELLGVTETGSFARGTSTLRLTRDVWADAGQAARWLAARARLAEVRAAGPQPGRDDKVVAGEAPAVLDDHGDLAEGLLALHAVTGEARWLRIAGSCWTVLAEFCDPGADGDWTRAVFHDARGAEDPALAAFGRPHDPADSATPSGTSATAGALLGYAALTGSARHREAAVAGLRPLSGMVHRAPQAFGWAMAVAEALADGPREIAVVGPDDDARARLRRVALSGTAPGRVVSVGEPDRPGVPLLASRAAVEGRATGYVCRGFVCDLPTTDAAALDESVGARRPR